MSDQQKQVYQQLQQALQNLQNTPQWKPQANPGQEALTANALAGNDWLQKGDYSQLPKGMFFNFQQPQQALDQYKKLSNVNQGGTFALAQGNPGGRTGAMALQGQYLNDRFARDASQNYQNNIANAGANIQGALQQSSGANLATQGLDLQGYGLKQQANLGALGTLGGLSNAYINRPSAWGSILGLGGQLGAAAINKF